MRIVSSPEGKEKPTLADRKRSKKVILADVAKRADVSISTVSRTLNAYPGISPHIQARVRKAAQDLGYRRHAWRKHSPEANRKTIFFLLTNRDLSIPVHSKILQVIERETSRHGDLLVYRSISIESDQSAESLDLSSVLHLNRGLHPPADGVGVILTGLTYPNVIEALRTINIAYMTLGNNYSSPNPLESSAVYFDGRKGANEATRYLIDLGHSRILFIGNPEIGWFQSLHQGYKEAINEADLPHIAQTKSLSDSFFSTGYSSVDMVFEQTAEVSAVLAGCDEIALGAWKALNDRGLSVPRDVSLIGFDDEEYSAFTVPPLTTVRIDTDAIGTELIQRLYQRMEDPTLEIPSVTLPATLIKRGTCRPVAALTPQASL